MDHREQHGTKQRQVGVPKVWNKPRTPKQHLIQVKHWKHHPRKRLHQKPDDATFIVNIRNAITEGQWQCTWMLRTFSTRHITPMLTLWKSLVQSKLDYCSQPQCPQTKGDIQSIEMVQRQFLCRISSLQNLSYWQQLKQLQPYLKKKEIPNIYVCHILEGQVPNIKHRWTDTQDHSQVAPMLRKGMCHTYSEQDCSPWCKETLLCQFACSWTAILQNSTYQHPQYNMV